MAKRHLHIQPEWGEAIRSGRKTIDARLVADDVAELKVGDVVRYPAVHARVLHLRYYPGYRDLLATEDWRRIAPDAAGPEEAQSLLQTGHSQTVHQTGAVAIELEVMKE
jgi:ASC-1-like (ASCH) protein